jgi:hypothetical protein
VSAPPLACKAANLIEKKTSFQPNFAILIVGAASSRDRSIIQLSSDFFSQLEAAPTRN